MKILITGSAGFIGSHLVTALAEHGHSVTGIDNLSTSDLSSARLAHTGISCEAAEPGITVQSTVYPEYRFRKTDITSKQDLNDLFREGAFDLVCHLAAFSGVRRSIDDPEPYIKNNINGFFNILESCRNYQVSSLVFASSSSVYGLNQKIPFSEHHTSDHPISLYAATKKSNEIMAHSYSHLYGIAATGVRFFTVYGPWGRPDMAPFLFTKAIMENRPVDIYNSGNLYRDFTYIDDIIDGLLHIINNPAKRNAEWNPFDPDPASSSAPFRIYNIGNSRPVRLSDFIEALERRLGKKAIKNLLPMQSGDVHTTYADVSSLNHDFGFVPKTILQEGVDRFADWYLNITRAE